MSFVEAAFGCKKTINITKSENCKECKGTGAKGGTEFETCKTCHGTGSARVTQNTMFGRVVTETSCKDCQGTGKKIKSKCTACGGKGSVREKKDISIDIPGGIDNGQVLTLKNQGEAGQNGGPNGDMHVVVSVDSHKSLKRKGFDVFTEIPIPLTKAMLGGKEEIDGINEKITVNIAPSTQSGTTLIARGKGTKILNRNAFGDLYATIRVEIPKNLSGKQKKMVEELEKSIKPNQYGS